MYKQFKNFGNALKQSIQYQSEPAVFPDNAFISVKNFFNKI